MIKTQQAAKLCGISRRTLQYYDEIGLIEVQRDKNGYRLYDQKQLERVWEILVYKDMGFSLQEIKELMVYKKNNYNLFKERIISLEMSIKEKNIDKLLVEFVMINGIPQCNWYKGDNYLKQIVNLRENLEKQKEKE